MCCHKRRCLFGKIINGIMQLNIAGATVEAVWHNLPHHFSFIELDAFVIMPNHVHGIIAIGEPQNNIANNQLLTNQTDSQPPVPKGTTPGSLGSILQNFKSVSTRRVNRFTRNSGTIWQRNYYEEIIRNEQAYNNIRRYIIENPLNWENDEENLTKFKPI
ncbi:MAG TPA: transposase [Leptolyngbyaceae cyanobacterium]